MRDLSGEKTGPHRMVGSTSGRYSWPNSLLQRPCCFAGGSVGLSENVETTFSEEDCKDRPSREFIKESNN